jgi:hypothetical protein
MEILIPLVMFGVFALVAVMAVRHAAKVRKEFPRWAEEIGWTAKPMTSWTTPAEATGAHAGRRGRVYSFTTGSGKSRTTWAAIELSAGVSSGLELELTRQGFGSKVAALFGAKEIQVGDAAFDARWFIRTNRPDYMKAALLPEFRARIEELERRGGRSVKLEIKQGRAIYLEQGFFQAPVRTRLAAALPVLADLAALAEVEAGSGAMG